MSGWLTNLEPFVHQYGLPGLFVDVFLEAMGLPLPGETLLIIAAGLAALGKLNIFAVAATAFAAAVVGDNAGYLIGRTLGRPLIVRHGQRIGITHERLDRVERIIQAHGAPVVAFARFFIVLRQLNGIAAGTAGMHWLKFLVANAIGAALWVGLWTGLAYHFGKDAAIFPDLWTQLSMAVPFIVGTLFAVLIGAWICRRRSAGGTG